MGDFEVKTDAQMKPCEGRREWAMAGSGRHVLGNSLGAIMLIRRVLLRTGFLLALWVLPLSVIPPAVTAGETFRWESLTIITGAGEHAFRVEIAETPSQRAQGLQHRQGLDPAHGMLFDFKTVQPAVMWMKNTYVPLDMLFIAADGRILNIARHTQPRSLASIASAGPVRGVLEIRAGMADSLGIKPGDKVRHPIFK